MLLVMNVGDVVVLGWLLESACLRRQLTSRAISTASKRGLASVNGELGQTREGHHHIHGRLCVCHGSLLGQTRFTGPCRPARLVAFALVGARPDTC
jgi:hypothetical protein